MGEILSNDTVNLLKSEEFRRAIRALVEKDQPTESVPVTVESPRGDTATVTLTIASS